MNSRLSCERVFNEVIIYIPKGLSKEVNCMREFLKNDPLNNFAELSPMRQHDIKNAAEKIRTSLLVKLKEKDSQSMDYIYIYDALRLFAYFFPRNQPYPENEQFVECPLTLMCLNNLSLYYVAADGYWFSLEGLSMLDIANDHPVAINPWTRESFLIEDLRRIKLLCSTPQVAFLHSPTVFNKQTLLAPLLLTGGYLAESIAVQNADYRTFSMRKNIQPVVQYTTLLLVVSQVTKYLYDVYKYRQARTVRHNLIMGDLTKEQFFDSLPQLRVSNLRCNNWFLSRFRGALFGKKNEGGNNVSSQENKSDCKSNRQGNN